LQKVCLPLHYSPLTMSEEEYAASPPQIEIRQVDLSIDQKGFRSKQYTIATTILQTKVYSREWITLVYRSRWLVELDIRSIKCSLNMDIIRAKNPAMVRTEIWSCLLAYNLVRIKMLQSCAVSGDMPRSLSFTTTLQLLSASWVLASIMLTEELIELGSQVSRSQTVGNRLDRIEPRANKRRPKLIALLTKPRHQARLEILAAACRNSLYNNRQCHSRFLPNFCRFRGELDTWWFKKTASNSSENQF
jgi:hypothetical protein